MKKIITFVIYGKDDKYFKGALENGKIAPKIYPEWTPRFYVSTDIPYESSRFLHDYGEVVYEEREEGHLPMHWRFRPFTDYSIDRFIVRDTDSRLNPREADAVKEWEDSGTDFHIMRDHPEHNAPICGGMWGATNSFNHLYGHQHEKNHRDFFHQLKTTAPHRVFHIRGKWFNTDQPYLWVKVYPLLEKGIASSMSHCKDRSLFRGLPNERLFRTTNPDNSFVGMPYEL